LFFHFPWRLTVVRSRLPPPPPPFLFLLHYNISLARSRSGFSFPFCSWFMTAVDRLGPLARFFSSPPLCTSIYWQDGAPSWLWPRYLSVMATSDVAFLSQRVLSLLLGAGPVDSAGPGRTHASSLTGARGPGGFRVPLSGHVNGFSFFLSVAVHLSLVSFFFCVAGLFSKTVFSPWSASSHFISSFNAHSSVSVLLCFFLGKRLPHG